MSKTGLFLTSLVPAGLAAILVYLLVMAFIDLSGAMSGALMGVAGLTLVVTALVALSPVAALVLGPRSEKAADEKDQDVDELETAESAEELLVADEADELVAGDDDDLLAADEDEAEAVAEFDDEPAETGIFAEEDSDLSDEIEVADAEEDVFVESPADDEFDIDDLLEDDPDHK